MDVVPLTLHGRLKFEYQGKLHTIIGDPEPYASCNVEKMEEFTMTYPRYKIEPLGVDSGVVKIEKWLQIAKTRLRTYKIENFDSLISIKYFGWMKILSIEGHK